MKAFQEPSKFSCEAAVRALAEFYLIAKRSYAVPFIVLHSLPLSLSQMWQHIYQSRSDCRKSNKFARQLGKLSPLIALTLLVSLLGMLTFHTTKVSRLRREVTAAQTSVQATKGELLQSQVSSQCKMQHKE